MRFDGHNSWENPATFQSSCNLDVQFFPFDKQKCTMVFRSLTADLSLMDLNTKVIESDDPQEGTSIIEVLSTQPYAPVTEVRQAFPQWNIHNVNPLLKCFTMVIEFINLVNFLLLVDIY